MLNKSLFLIISLVIFAGILFSNCSREKKDENPYLEEMDPRTKIRFRQYMIIGKRLYSQHCANCHGQEGEGLETLMPPLAESDYLMTDIPRTACLISNGIEGEITVNGKMYNQPMPGHDDLRALEIAEIMTYITNSWGNEKGMISVRDVEGMLERCEQ